MVHPNYTATNYVWEKFISSCVDEPSQQLMKEINSISIARRHKAFNPSSEAHKKFLQIHFNKSIHLMQRYPYINLEEEAAYFGDI
jgi:hypothetical protein